MDSTLHSLLIARLEASALDAVAREAVLAETDASAAVANDTVAEAGEVYLRSVPVEGFRGIGKAATLKLSARPGRTIVVGRNGSGKSSFAEGLELLLTGQTKRWESKTKGWTSAWQCLHHDQPTTLRAELVVAGRPQPVVLVEQVWERGVAHTDTTGRAPVDALLATHRWARRCPRPAITASTTLGLPSPSYGRTCGRQMRSAGRSVRSLRRAPGRSGGRAPKGFGRASSSVA